MRADRDVQKRTETMDKMNTKTLKVLGLGGIFFVIFIISMYQIGLDGIEVISSAVFFYLGMWFLVSMTNNYRQKRKRWVVYLACAFFLLYQIFVIFAGHFSSW
ncbi:MULTISPECIES: hypothetical protein [Alteribacter]|uniref:Uncharacterized protein n=1 Tax=Alteribacter keqinensis TaxID=2483800 RepID=A0A3M7TRP6_9BACI|nr:MULTISPECIES: hypothetical protein [Alteribacter]MBM7095540.1 hypothetical protein [Alteribacter salitolerans]RNA67859.1 hypothetical protein EBO34_14245 [Alteribacter keqinensis]